MNKFTRNGGNNTGPEGGILLEQRCADEHYERNEVIVASHRISNIRKSKSQGNLAD